jgi:hypothetical protein
VPVASRLSVGFRVTAFVGDAARGVMSGRISSSVSKLRLSLAWSRSRPRLERRNRKALGLSQKPVPFDDFC